MNTNANVVATFTDRFGEERKIHHTRFGLAVKRVKETNSEVLSRAIAKYVGERIREIRKSKGMTMQELGIRAALSTSNTVKNRVYEIEKSTFGTGIRFGTAYQIAIALGVEVSDFLPSTQTVKEMTGAKLSPAEIFSLE